MLLLKRSSKHNDATWGLPGGNAEQGDADLQATALREATEELGTLPSHSIGASLLTKRGKNKQKHYTGLLPWCSRCPAERITVLNLIAWVQCSWRPSTWRSRQLTCHSSTRSTASGRSALACLSGAVHLDAD